jgi:hypothetical protein
MAQELLYPTVLQSRGPWLIGTKDLLALDEIVEQIGGEDGTRILKISLPKERELKTSSFKEAMSHMGSQDETAIGFRYEVKTKSNTASVRLFQPTDSGKEKDDTRPKLEVRVSPRGTESSQEIIGLFKSWVADVQPPIWKRWLLALRSAARGFLVLTVLIGPFIVLNTKPSVNEYKEIYKQQARELLKNGINQQNETKATELMLALQSDYIPPGAKPQSVSLRSLVILVIIVLILGVLSATPSMCLGIWKGKQRLRLWDLWFRVNFYTVPGLILTSVFWPQLVSAFEHAFRP